MMLAPSLIIRADATPTMGTGHVMRSLALAQAAQRSGLEVHLVCRANVKWVRERLSQENIPLHFVEDEPPAAESPKALLKQIRIDNLHQLFAYGREIWVVTDGYHFAYDCQKEIRSAGYKLLVIDDYAHLAEYNCDILLNQNFGAEQLAYKGTVGSKLLGPRYALLRLEFLSSYGAKSKAATNGLRILLTLGGGNFSPYLRELAAVMRKPKMQHITLLVLPGAMPDTNIREAFVDTPVSLRILPRVDNMATLLRDIDLCVSAGGSTCWELACMGVPFLTVQVAENQRLICQWLEKKGYAPRLSADAFTELLWDDECRQSLSARLRKLVDGRGACRVIDAIQTI